MCFGKGSDALHGIRCLVLVDAGQEYGELVPANACHHIFPPERLPEDKGCRSEQPVILVLRLILRAIP